VTYAKAYHSRQGSSPWLHRSSLCRGFCRYFCPFGVWGIVGEKIGHALRDPRVMLSADASKCTQCHTCDRACPMQLPVSDMVADEHMRTTECFACGSCVDGCKQGAIRWGFGRAE
jgi:ferredoxin-type protein NapH